MIGREGPGLTLNNIKYNRKTKGKINTFFFCFSIPFSICILFNVRRREKIWPRPTAQDKLKIEYLLFIGRGEGWVVSSLSRSPTFPFLLSFLFLLFVFLLYVYFYFILSFAILIPYISFSKIANHKIEINKEKQRERKERSKWKLDTRGLETTSNGRLALPFSCWSSVKSHVDVHQKMLDLKSNKIIFL